MYVSHVTFVYDTHPYLHTHTHTHTHTRARATVSMLMNSQDYQRLQTLKNVEKG